MEKKIETHNAHRVDKVTEAKWGLNDETHSTHTKKVYRATHNSTLTVMNVRALSLPIFENNYAKLTHSKIYYTTNNPSFVLNSYSLAIFPLCIPLWFALSPRSSVYLRARYEHDNGTFTQNRFAVFIIQIASIWWNAWITHLLYETKSRQKRTHHDHPLCYYFAVVRLCRHFFWNNILCCIWMMHSFIMHVCLCECVSVRVCELSTIVWQFW